MSESARRLRQQASGYLAAGRPTRTRYPAEFREQVLDLAREKQRHGQSLSRIASELGLKAKTLSIWLRSSSRAAVRRVVVAPEAPAGLEAGSLVVVAGSLRIEGFTVEGVARLLRALG